MSKTDLLHSRITEILGDRQRVLCGQQNEACEWRNKIHDGFKISAHATSDVNIGIGHDQMQRIHYEMARKPVGAG